MNTIGGSLQEDHHGNHQSHSLPSTPACDSHISHQGGVEKGHLFTHSHVGFNSPGLPIPKKTPGSSAKKLDKHPLTLSSPGPAHKTPGSSTRNELYLKSVLSSPYQHKSNSPLPATPCSSSFQTPIRSACNSPSNQLCSTPQGTKPPIPVHATPKQKIVNPFDHGILDALHGPMFMSPGVFSIASTPSTDEKKPFKWGIEHIAELHPVDIEEMPLHQDVHLLPDRETEERAQMAIDRFFSNHLIAPSPMSVESKKVLQKTPSSEGSGSRFPVFNLEDELQGSIQKQLPKKLLTQEVGCQTTLSLPVDFDIAKVLGGYMNQATEETNNEILSTSSLRRKLFFQGDTSSVAPSPVRGGGGHLDDSLSADVLAASPQVSPVSQQMQTWEQATPLKTPSRNQFSSSPIKNPKGLKSSQFHTPPNEDFLESPEISPIVRGHMRRTRSSGLFVPHDNSFFSENMSGGDNRNSASEKPLISPEVSPIKGEFVMRSGNSISEKPLISPEVSPIKSEFVMRTPSSEERSRHSLQDPGISPIHAHPGNRSSDDEGSFIQGHQGYTSDDGSDHDRTTPMPAIKTEKRRTGSTRKISHLTRHRQRNILPENDDIDMDFETLSSDKNPGFADNIKTSSLLITRDFSFIDMEMTSENTAAPNSTNQDTGYHTASLQSTNQDTGLHTNLTTQFNSLPFNTTNPDMMYTSTSMSTSNHELMSCSASEIKFHPENSESISKKFKRPVNNDSAISHSEFIPDDEKEEKLVQQILEISRTEKCGPVGDTMSEEEILYRARQVLAMANSLYPDMKSESDGPSMKTKLLTHRRLSILNELEPLVSSSQTHKGPSDMFTDSEVSNKEPSPSEQALAIIRRAGEDLARYSQVFDSVKS